MVSPSSSSRPDPSSLVSPRTDTLISAARLATDPGAGGRFRGWVSRLMGGGGGGSDGRSTDLPPDLPADGQLSCGDNTERGVKWSRYTGSIHPPDRRRGLTGADVEPDGEVLEGREAGRDVIEDRDNGGEKSVTMSDSLISLNTLPARENCPY